MVELTRANIFIMGKVALQLGVESPEQLEEIVRFYATYNDRAQIALRASREALTAPRPYGFD